MAKKKESVEQTVSNIRRKTRKQYSSEEKIRVDVLVLLRRPLFIWRTIISLNITIEAAIIKTLRLN